MSELTTHTITAWHEYDEVVRGADYRSWAFRGQADASWPVYSALSRYLLDFGIHQGAWAAQEERMYRVFRRKAHLYLEHVPEPSDAFQWLALMQHHGAPTRLLDFTWSPYVAAFFALERAKTEAAVWAVSVPALENATRDIELRLADGEISLRWPRHYEDYFLGNDVPFVVSGEPFVMNQRLIAQSGTFLVPSVLDQPLETILLGLPSEERIIARFDLADSLRDEAMAVLYSMNITNATLFPGLDGMARSLAYELEEHWGFNPKTLEPAPGHEAFVARHLERSLPHHWNESDRATDAERE